MRTDDGMAQGDLYEDDDDFGFDLEIYERLHEALDSAGPSEEAQDRMLSKLLEAQRMHEEESAVDPQVVDLNDDFDYVDKTDKQGQGGLTLVGGKKRRPRSRTIALAVAASLMLAVMGVSVASQANKASSSAADYAQETAVPSETDVGASPKELAPEAESVSYSSEEVATGSAVDEATGGAIESDSELEMFEQSGGAFDVSSDPSYELAVAYPEIRLRSGEVLMIEEHLGDPVIIGDEWVEGFKGDADAFSEDGKDSVRCWVYLLPVSDDGLYVVRYVQDGSCYAARVVE